jgi:nucleotide-binding universal stress UspA family protein
MKVSKWIEDDQHIADSKQVVLKKQLSYSMKTPSKKFLIPVDFSDTARRAVDYGAALAQKNGSSILLLHITSLHLSGMVQDDQMFITQDIEEIENEQLEKWRVEAESRFPGVRFETRTMTGFPVEWIKQCAEEEQVDLILMGTKGAQGVQEIVLGSHTATLINQTDCPVLAIPEEASFRGIRKIVVATNLEKEDLMMLHQTLDLFGHEKPQITLLHIESSGERDPEAALMNWFHSDILPKVQYPGLKPVCIEENNVIEAMESYMNEEKPDLLVTSTRKRNFFERIFERSVTQKMAFHTHIPLLALHVHESKGRVVF